MAAGPSHPSNVTGGTWRLVTMELPGPCALSDYHQGTDYYLSTVCVASIARYLERCAGALLRTYSVNAAVHAAKQQPVVGRGCRQQ